MAISAAQDIVRTYLSEIGKVPLLTNVEEVELARKVTVHVNISKQLQTFRNDNLSEQQSWEFVAKSLEISIKEAEKLNSIGLKAKQKMIEANLRLVVSIAKKYQDRGLELMDLIQEGTIGLERAVLKFDPLRGYKFSTYAYWWIKQGITRAIAEKGREIRLPIHVTEQLNKLKKTQRVLTLELARPATRGEIAVAMNISQEKVTQLLRVSSKPISLDALIGPAQEDNLLSFISDDQNDPYISETSEMESSVKSSVASLTQQQQAVIKLRFALNGGSPLTLAEIGRQLNISRERVRQIQKQALATLKSNKHRDLEALLS